MNCKDELAFGGVERDAGVPGTVVGGRKTTAARVLITSAGIWPVGVCTAVCQASSWILPGQGLFGTSRVGGLTTIIFPKRSHTYKAHLHE